MMDPPLSRSMHVEQIERLEARVAVLMAALREYGRHDDDCDVHDLNHTPDLGPICTCGFDAAAGGEYVAQ